MYCNAPTNLAQAVLRQVFSRLLLLQISYSCQLVTIIFPTDNQIRIFEELEFFERVATDCNDIGKRAMCQSVPSWAMPVFVPNGASLCPVLDYISDTNRTY